MGGISLGRLVDSQVTDFYCPLPFRHAYIDTSGVSPCCQITRQKVDLQDWHRNALLVDIQQHMKRGDMPESCKACHWQEQHYGRSLRTDALKDYQQQRFQDTQIDFVDYRYSNVCNFKCRSCSGQYSHGIAKETRDNPVLQRFLPLIDEKTVTMDRDNHQWIINNLSGIKRLMLTGGEPTIIPEVRKILEAVIQQKRQDMSVMITTNGSFTDPFWYALTRELPNLHWTISIDAVGRDAEIIRHGTKCADVDHNARWLAAHAASLDINTVISNLNARKLRPVLELGHLMQKLSQAPLGRHGDQGCRHQFYVCQRPYYLAADNWPDDQKQSVIKDLATCLDLDLDPEQSQTVNGLIQQISSAEFDPVLWQQSLDYNNELDRVRGQDHRDLMQ